MTDMVTLETYRLHELGDNPLIRALRAQLYCLVGKPGYKFVQKFTEQELYDIIPGIHKTFFRQNPDDIISRIAESGQLPLDYLITPAQRFIVYCRLHKWEAEWHQMGKVVRVTVYSDHIFNHNIEIFKGDDKRLY